MLKSNSFWRKCIIVLLFSLQFVDEIAAKDESSISKPVNGIIQVSILSPVIVLNSIGLGEDIGDASNSGIVFSALVVPQLVDAFFLGYFADTDKYISYWYTGISYLQDKTRFTTFNGLGAHVVKFSGFQPIPHFRIGFEYEVDYKRVFDYGNEISVYFPVTLGYNHALTALNSLNLSLGIGQPFHFVDPRNKSGEYSFLYDNTTFKGTIALFSKEHNIVFSYYEASILSPSDSDTKRVFGLSYGQTL